MVENKLDQKGQKSECSVDANRRIRHVIESVLQICGVSFARDEKFSWQSCVVQIVLEVDVVQNYTMHNTRDAALCSATMRNASVLQGL